MTLPHSPSSSSGAISPSAPASALRLSVMTGVPTHRARRFARMAATRIFMAPLLALVACSTTHVSTDYDPSADFSAFHTFTLIEREHVFTENPLVLQRTYDAIRAELSRKGFAYVSHLQQADFAVDFTVGAGDRLDMRDPVSGGSGQWGNQVDVRLYREGTLAIDMYDARSRRPVWHGSAEKKLSKYDIEHSAELIRDTVTAVLADFPPKNSIPSGGGSSSSL